MRKYGAQASFELPAATARSLHGQAAIESSCGPTVRSLHGQAAMEYLVTYGWALLGLFIVVAYLISSGTFSAGSFAVQECYFQPDLSCPSFILHKQADEASPTTLRFRLVNGLGFPIRITSVMYTTSNMGVEGVGQYVGSVPLGTIVSGAEMEFTQLFSGPRQPSLHDFKTVYVTLNYTNCKRDPCAGEYTTSGRVASIVEQG